MLAALVAVAAGSLLGSGAAASVSPRRSHASSSPTNRRPAQSEGSLTFGIYPGGIAGTIGPSGPARPEIDSLRLQSLEGLRDGHRRFVLHLYDSYENPSDADAVPAWLASQIAEYTAHGFQIELVLTYRPDDPAGDVPGFVRYVRARVAQLGSNRAVTSFQVMNEANVDAPGVSDGGYPGAEDALVQGVIAAKAAARRAGYTQLRIGFNWFYELGKAQDAFFSDLWKAGGKAFATAVDWVGVDAYPGTWGPALPSGDLAAAVRSATLGAIRACRLQLLPLAHLASVPLHFSESGYPTGAGRTDRMQQTVMLAAVGEIAASRRRYGITDYRWFDLRDGDSSSASFEQHYGLMRDDYTPKPAYFTYRKLIIGM